MLDARLTAEPALPRSATREAEAPRTEAALPAEAAAFEARVRPHIDGLHRFCLSLTRDDPEAEDLFQEALLKAYVHAAAYGGQGSLFGWLCSIARREHLERRRSRGRRQALFDRVREGVSEVLGSVFGGGAPVSPEAQALALERSDRFLAALRSVPETYRPVVELVEVEGLTYAEVAAALELPVGTVKSRHARGQARLVEEFRRLWGDEP